MSDALYESHAGRTRVRNGAAGMQRSRITNGTAFLPGVDGRGAWIRRAKDLIAEHVADLGGVDNTSAAERSLVRRASVVTVELEFLEAKFAAAGQAATNDLDLYLRASNNLRRLLEAIGLQRRMKDVSIDPLAYARTIERDAP
jgi:hypothetical protein